MWGTCKIVNFSWLLFSTLVIGQNLLTQKNTLSKWNINAFYCVNGLHVGLCILRAKMRTFLCGESTVAAQQKKLLSTLPGSLLNLLATCTTQVKRRFKKKERKIRLRKSFFKGIRTPTIRISQNNKLTPLSTGPPL